MNTNKNYKIELQHTKRNDCTIMFTFDDLILIKNEDIDKFTLSSLIQMIKKILGRNFNVNHYLSTFRFYQQLTLIDKSLPKYGFVYLRIIDKDKKICKIGRTFNIQRRYNKELQESILALIPVQDDIKVENELKAAFNRKLKIVNRTRETFIYNNIQDTKKLFSNIADKYKVNASYKDSIHVLSMKVDNKKHEIIYLSLPVCEIIFNNFVNSPVYINKFNTMKNYINASLNEDVYISNEYNTKLETNCIFWKFHKYTIIQNESDLYVNGSRLWNSIIKNDGKKKQIKFSKFLKLKQIQKIKAQFEKFYPGEPLYRPSVVNKSQPHFSGIYVHYVLIHFILSYLDASYAILVSELMYRQYHNNYLANVSKGTMKGGNRLMTQEEYSRMIWQLANA